MIALAISLDKQLLIFKSSYLDELPSAITLYSRYGPMAFLAQAVEAWVWNGEDRASRCPLLAQWINIPSTSIVCPRVVEDLVRQD